VRKGRFPLREGALKKRGLLDSGIKPPFNERCTEQQTRLVILTGKAFLKKRSLKIIAKKGFEKKPIRGRMARTRKAKVGWF